MVLLAEDSASGEELLNLLIGCITNEKYPFGDLACMLLSNLAKTDRAKAFLVGGDGDDRKSTTNHLPTLISIMNKGRSHNPNCDYDFIASILTDATTTREGRAFFLDHQPDPHLAPKLFTVLVPMLGSSTERVIRRGGALTAIKNCLFETDRHPAILEADEEEERLLVGLLAMLVDKRGVFDETDLDEMPLDINLEHRFTPSEPDMVLRAMAVESLILLTTTLEGRQVLRRKKIVRCACIYAMN